ncbi:hypothetical protein ACFFSW_05985 [Saccharothrix longispora]|uniref:Membrane protein YesL n=1 Tax=Saccharothrix longispora TaxID=33920 RepID=A0ABU1PTH7_9PSEU|nr:hypothetical protein [Saccharothrix longispora]MDR6593955.1 hypothetical protein [Saccharothrix longispora]
MRKLALLGECLTAGLLVLLVALPVVTLVPALAAGCAHVKAHVDGETTAVRAFFARVRSALPGGWQLSLGVVAAFAVLAVDLVVLGAGLAGGVVVMAVCSAAAAGLAVVVLRSAATWSPGARWGAVVREAARRAAVDARGSSLVLMALGVLVVVTWQLPALFVPMVGCVLMAAVAVERRPVG